ncbi:hypothetical protein Scep_024385 [Stephania cephalantha]|uniref:Uncharacterized protein n=1 Tax=Stephania cephalantha TaxID=152367 RepID=A0AAP0EZ77_9MAGN
MKEMEEDLKQFCKWGSRTPGHPENFETPGVEVTTGSNCLPPHPSSMKTQVEARKGKKATSAAEHVHALCLFQNRYLQWRYANAKAEATKNVQSHTVERSFYALLVKKSEMHDSVQRKRVELGYLKKLAMLSSIMGAQMPYLDEWSTLECEYSSSLSGAIKALQDASVQLPISGNMKEQVGFPIEIGEKLASASIVLVSDMFGVVTC